MKNRYSWPAIVLVLLAATVHSEEVPVRRVCTKNTVFRLPVQMSAADRADLKEIKFYVKSPPSTWVCRETAAPSQTAFAFRAPADGEYWFTIATVDKSGQTTPANLDAESPGLIVVVDTQNPDLDVRAEVVNGKAMVQCKLVDKNADPASLKVECEMPGQGWHLVTAASDKPGHFVLPDNRLPGGKIRVRGADAAGNVATKTIDGPSVVAAAPPVMPTPPPMPATEPTTGEKPGVISLGNPPSSPNALPAGLANAPLTPATIIPASIVEKPPTHSVPDVGAPAPLPMGIPSSPTPAPAPTGSPIKVVSSLPIDQNNKDIPLVNALRCRLDFSIEPAPIEGARISVWATSDKGKTWTAVGTCRDARGPALTTFPADGVYGYSFVVTNDPSAEPRAPKTDETPDGWIEVDTTKPIAELLSAKLGTDADAGHLVLTWVAQDKNLGNEPVAIHYSTQPAGPWQPVAARVANSGKHRWAIPKEAGPRIYLRLEVIDRAGNVARCDWPTPIIVDGGRHKVTVLSVTPAGQE